MKNKLFPILFAFPFTAGLCAAMLRTSLFKYTVENAELAAPVLYGLTAVCIIAILMALVASFLLKDGMDFSSASLSKALKVVFPISAGVIFAYAIMLLLPLRYEFDATKIVLSLLSIYCAASLFILGKHSLAERDSTAYCIFSAVPDFWACFVIVLAFREKVSDPIISNYVFIILSYISILFSCYCIAAHVLGKKRKGFALFSCFAGMFFIITELLTPLFSGTYPTYTAEEICELLPLVAFLILIPFSTAEIAKK